jgi:hypothetical protein
MLLKQLAVIVVIAVKNLRRVNILFFTLLQKSTAEFGEF